jgi:hypothetical protein
VRIAVSLAANSSSLRDANIGQVHSNGTSEAWKTAMTEESMKLEDWRASW